MRVGTLVPASFSMTNDSAMSPALLVVRPVGANVVLPVLLLTDSARGSTSPTELLR